MTLTQILQKIRSAFYTKAELDVMGGGVSLDTTIKSKANDSSVVHKDGDTITGVIFNRNVDNSRLEFRGATDYTKGSYLLVCGKDDSRGGRFELGAYNDIISGSLQGYPDGRLTWVGKHIVRSVNDFTADANGNVDLLPIGSYIQFAGNQAPAGFLVCNGGAISRTTYAKLFSVIGTKYGSGDGSTTFNLPNLTDRFLQGSGTSGTVRNAGLPDITGAWENWDLPVSRVPLKPTDVTGAFISSAGSANIAWASGGNGIWNALGFHASKSNSIYGNSETVQPPALTCLICIKY